MSNYFSDLFGLGNSSSSSSNDPFGINLTDYASIKNGSYRKLLAANYAKTQEEEGTSSSTSGVKDSKQTLTSISDAASDLQKSISTVSSLFKTEKDENGRTVVNYDEDKMYKALKDFVNNYNSLLDEAEKAESTSLLRTATSLVSFTKANEKALESVGISVGSDNKLSINEDKFKEASKSSVQSLFQSTGGYAYQVDAKASNLKITADELAKKAKGSSTGSSKSSGLSSSLSTSKDSTKTLANIQDAAEKASKSLSVLLESGYKSKFKTETKKDANGKYYEDYDKDGIYSAVKDFIKDYNSLLDKTEDSTTSSIAQASKSLINYAKANESALKEIGITIDSDDNLVIDKDKFMKADMAKVKALFQNSGSFGKQIEALYTKIGIYAENEASKSNTYSNSGNYSYNYNSGDWFNSGL